MKTRLLNFLENTAIFIVVVGGDLILSVLGSCALVAIFYGIFKLIKG
jgi:hypothetical protein